MEHSAVKDGKIRLAYYSYDSLGNPWVSGGGALRDFEVLRRFARHAQVTLHTGRYPGFRDREEDGIRLRAYGFGNSNWVCRWTYALAANIRILFDRADVIGMSPSIYAPVIAGLLRRRIYFVVHHTVGMQSFRKYGPLGAVSFLCEQLFLRCGRNYFVSNRSLRDRIVRVNPKARVELTQNGFDPSLLQIASRPAQPPFILFLGRFDVYMKGLDLLIAAFAEIALIQGVDLVLAGRASESAAQEVKKLIPNALKDRIRLELGITETRKSELLASCLFFCSPSRFEGFGIAALEANAAGKAALVTDTDGFRDSLALGETAIGVKAEDQGELKAAMIRLIEDGELREKLGRSGRERAKKFSWDAIAEAEWGWVRETIIISHNPP